MDIAHDRVTKQTVLLWVLLATAAVEVEYGGGVNGVENVSGDAGRIADRPVKRQQRRAAGVILNGLRSAQNVIPAEYFPFIGYVVVGPVHQVPVVVRVGIAFSEVIAA